MKQYTFTSLFFFSILFLTLSYSCQRDIKSNTLSIELEKKIDSLNRYLNVASQQDYSEADKIEAIDNFIKGANSLDLDSLVFNGLKKKSNILFKYGHHKKAIEQVHLMVKLSKENSDSINLGKAYYKIGYFYKKNDNYLEAFKFYNQSFKVLRNLNDSINAGRCLMAMSSVQRTLGDHNASKTTATDGLKYLENSTEYRTVSGLYHGISISFLELGNYTKAMVWNNKVFDLTKDSITLKQIGIKNLPLFKNTRAIILAEQKKFIESIKILDSLTKDKYVLKNMIEYSRILNNLGYIKFKENPNNKESETLLMDAFRIRKQEKDVLGIFNSNIHLSKYYKNKDINKAKRYAYEAYNSIKDFKDYEALLEVLTLITELNPDSLEDHQRFKDASLKLMQLRKKTREIYAPTRFENESLLKENEKKNRKISEVRNQNVIYLLGILLLLTGIGFIVYFFRQQMRYLNHQNKIGQFQASYETETRIAKRLHDELGNDIFHAMMQYQNDPHDPQIKEKLNKAYVKARDISRENNEFEIGDTYPEELSNMLQNYTQNEIQLIAIGFDKINWGQMDKTVKITVYRVLQELMTNMQKHSKASLVKLVFSNPKDTLTIKYSDNGVGVTEEHLKSKNGLRNTEKRIHAIRGTLIFDSDKDKGFKAEIQIPN
ncbi:tetratricopeptide repeat-containing sensor histidine kinase [Aquimarina sediminis]|uniref:tetratricopeptide repeat-containing sensor histidine kinase n=1 Tax=Aquimarina sediminis TaxID=2070536 RepID=UPI000CA020D2|nr:ATP-binding protein [Aquimarina sediminis]